MKKLVTFATFFPLLLGLTLAIVWFAKVRDFEPFLAVIGSLATIIGIFGQQWASAYEKRHELLRALLYECSSNAAILSDQRFNPEKHKLGKPIIFPRLIVSATETAIASDVFAKAQDRNLFSLLHQWRHIANEFNHRLDITELRTFTFDSAEEIRSLHEALRESKEFNDALSLTSTIEDTLKSKSLIYTGSGKH